MNTALISSHTPGSGDTQGILTAFCATRPEPTAVAQMLQELGFHLAFFLAADDTDAAAKLPPIPAQYHYEDEVGTNVAYLAGVDWPCLADDDDEPEMPSCYRYPVHASRFWLTPGGRELVTRRVRDALAVAWDLSWQDLCAVQPIVDAA